MVGGNVLTSQRVVDVVLRAFGACAASQGCMNNVTLGTEEWGYYETVAGGSGAVRDSTCAFLQIATFSFCDIVFAKGPDLGRQRRGAHSHDQHENHRPGDTGTSLPAHS